MSNNDRNDNKYECTVNPSSSRLNIRGVDYHLTEWGTSDAPLFFYLHGWADTGSTFQFVVDALSDQWRIIAPDWRGFGRSAHIGESYWFPDYLADLNDILAHFSPDDPVCLVGHSMGGNIASLYAGIFPERVNALINIEGFGLKASDPATAPQNYRRWLESTTSGECFSTYRDFSRLAVKIQHRNSGLSAAAAEFVARQWAVERDDRVSLRADAKHKLPNPVLYRRAEAEACWANITARCLLLSGGQSSFADVFGASDTLPFPNAENRSITKSGHMLHFEAPSELAHEIESFLK